jgi:hypothetical protein
MKMSHASSWREICIFIGIEQQKIYWYIKQNYNNNNQNEKFIMLKEGMFVQNDILIIFQCF